MSNVNQAFLRAYSKDRRQTQAGGIRNDRVAGKTFETGASAEPTSVQYHRVNPGDTPVEIPTPWISSVEVVGILTTPDVRTRKSTSVVTNPPQKPQQIPPLQQPTTELRQTNSQDRGIEPMSEPVQAVSIEPRLHTPHAIPRNHFDRFALASDDDSDSTQRPAADLPRAPAESATEGTTTLRDYIDRTRGSAIRFTDVSDDFDASREHNIASLKQRQKELRWEEEQRARLAEAQLRAIQRQHTTAPPKTEELHPVWEVDRFYWPEISDRLLQAEALSFQQIGNHLISSSNDGLRTLAVTSAREGTGRTTVAICLTRIAAKAGLRVALIDADVNHPSLADQLNIEFAHGWEEHIANGIPLDECAIQSVEEGLTIFPCKVDAQPLSLALDHPKIREMIGQMAGTFDLVILDCNHLGAAGGKLLGSGRDGTIDAAALVVDGTSERHDVIDYAIERLQQIGIHSVGLIENGIG